MRTLLTLIALAFTVAAAIPVSPAHAMGSPRTRDEPAYMCDMNDIGYGADGDALRRCCAELNGGYQHCQWMSPVDNPSP